MMNDENANQSPAEPTREEADELIALTKMDPELRDQVLRGAHINGVVPNGAFEAWNKAIEVAVGIEPKPEEPKPDPVLDAPASPEAYKVLDLMGHPVQMDAENSKLVHETLLPAAHSLGLSQTDLNMVTPAVMKPTSYEDCERTLHKLWGANYEANAQDFAAAIEGADPKYRALLEQYPEHLGNNAHLIAAVVNAYRRRQGNR